MKSVANTIVEEIGYILGNKSGLVLLLLAPVLFIGCVCAVYWNKKIADIPVCIIDRDNSTISRDIKQAIDASESFRVVGLLQSVQDFEHQVVSGKAVACFSFPVGFSRDIKQGKPAKTMVFLDTSNLIVANIVSTNASTILGSYSAGTDMRKIMAKGKMTKEAVAKTTMPIKDEYRVMYNPAFNNNYANFMLPGMSMVVIQLMTLLLVAGSMSSERKIKHSIPATIIGKCLAYTLLASIPAMLVVLIPILLMGIPVAGSIWLLLGIACWFVGILSIFGAGVSALARDTLQATEYFAIIAMPAFLLSGYTWPDYAMPSVLIPLAHSLPLTAPAIIARKICLNGADTGLLIPEITTMLVWTLFAMFTAMLGAYRVTRTNRTGVSKS